MSQRKESTKQNEAPDCQGAEYFASMCLLFAIIAFAFSAGFMCAVDFIQSGNIRVKSQAEVIQSLKEQP